LKVFFANAVHEHSHDNSDNLTGRFLTPLLVPFSFWYLRPGFAKVFSPRTAQNLGDVGRTAFLPNC
jgi:hypothetical protein